VSADTVTVPTLGDIDDDTFGATFMASEDQRFRWVERMAEVNGVDSEACPPEWRRRGPLAMWVWLVLHLNAIPFDPADPQPACVYGLDFGFADTSTRRTIWLLA
jgi:hypothetical protein